MSPSSRASLTSRSFSTPGRVLGVQISFRCLHVFQALDCGLDLRERRHDNSILIPDDDVAGTNRDAADHHGEANRARAAAHWRVGGDAGREARQTDRADALLVAHEPIRNEDGDPNILHHADEEVAHDRGGRKGFRRAEHDIAGLRHRERAERRQIVVRAGLARQRDAAKGSRAADWLDVLVERAAAIERVDHEAGLEAGKGPHLGRGGARKIVAGSGEAEDF
jgi:hypothetical protein